jgi:hypothetical protein
MHSEIGIEIDAPPSLVFALACGVERWERLLPHYARSRQVASSGGALVVDFIARTPLVPVLGLGLPVTWRARTWSEPAGLRLRFVHVAGATRGMDVTWRIESAPRQGPHGRDDGPTRVTIEHDFAPRVPGFAAFVDRAFTRPIAGRTLAAFKALAEAVAAAGASTPASESPEQA